MDVKELRIGNYLSIGKTQQIQLKESLFALLLTKDASIEIFLPIPLTEEWLVKFGFRCRFDIGYNGWYSPNILGESIRIFELENGWFKYSSAHTVIKNLHQLQNLYYALTNEELTIK